MPGAPRRFAVLVRSDRGPGIPELDEARRIGFRDRLRDELDGLRARAARIRIRTRLRFSTSILDFEFEYGRIC
jgi:hypothetical protein